jgi:hypothetical protein
MANAVSPVRVTNVRVTNFVVYFAVFLDHMSLDVDSDLALAERRYRDGQRSASINGMSSVNMTLLLWPLDLGPPTERDWTNHSPPY